MPIAVLDIDLEQFPPTISGLERYNSALVLIRLRGRPVGQALLPLTDGRIDGSELRERLIDAAGWPLWQQWLRGALDLDAREAAQHTLPTATLAICTRDRPEALRRCLDAMMQLPDDGQEILVVDNAPSSEATRMLVAEYPRVRYLREDRAGLSVARNRAMREARHEVVAFADDDTLPDAAWLRALLRNFADPMVLGVTGLVMPLELETAAQEWFEQYRPFGRGFERKVFSSANHNPLVGGPIGAGASMALRRTVYQLIGPFNEALGAGSPARAHADNELFSRVLLAGYRMVYDPAALSWHRHRVDWEEFCQTLYRCGVGIYAGWTGYLLTRGEFGVFAVAWGWFRYVQAPALLRSLLRRPGSTPLSMLLAELRGCATGPRAYFVARQQLRKHSTDHELPSHSQRHHSDPQPARLAVSRAHSSGQADLPSPHV